MRYLLVLSLVFLVGCVSPRKPSERFFGIKVPDAEAAKSFNIKGYEGDILNFSYSTDSEPRVSVYCSLYSPHDLTLTVENQSGEPIKLNYYADNFAFVDLVGNKYVLEKIIDFEHEYRNYPSGHINPGETKRIFLKSSRPSYRNEIKLIAGEFALSDCMIVLKPLPEKPKAPKK